MTAIFTESWEQEKKSHVAEARSTRTWCIEFASQAQDDLDNAFETRWRMPKSKAAPSWAAPLELSMAILQPRRQIFARGRKPGLSCGKQSEAVTAELERRVIVIAEVRAAPLAANKSSPSLWENSMIRFSLLGGGELNAAPGCGA